MTIDIQYANEHLIEISESELSEIKKLRDIKTFSELSSLNPKDKRIMKNLIYNIVTCAYCMKSGGFVPKSKIKVIAKDNNNRNIWCFAIRDVTPSYSRYIGVKTEYKIFDCSSPIWDREVNQW